MKKIFTFFIRAYQLSISPMLGNRCRFHPSCSTFAIESIEEKGVVAGGAETIKRLLRCHPFHSGGYDPVCKSQKVKIV